jgi:hypothetical protein
MLNLPKGAGRLHGRRICNVKVPEMSAMLGGVRELHGSADFGLSNLLGVPFIA